MVGIVFSSVQKMVWLPTLRIFSVRTIAYGGYTNALRESAVSGGRKCRTGQTTVNRSEVIL